MHIEQAGSIRSCLLPLTHDADDFFLLMGLEFGTATPSIPCRQHSSHSVCAIARSNSVPS